MSDVRNLLRGLMTESESLRATPCGVLWFVHISKCGGSFINSHLEWLARLHGWSHADLQHPRGMAARAQGKLWNSTLGWRTFQAALGTPDVRPRFVVHHHDGVPSLLDPTMQTIQRDLVAKLAQHGCKLWHATVLRDPQAHAISSAQWASKVHADPEPSVKSVVDRDVSAIGGLWETERETATSASVSNAGSSSVHMAAATLLAQMRVRANEQTKYLALGDWRKWPIPEAFALDPTWERSRLHDALALIESFALIGRSEAMQSFLNAVAAMLGWWQPSWNRSLPQQPNDCRVVPLRNFRNHTKWPWRSFARCHELVRAFANATERKRVEGQWTRTRAIFAGFTAKQRSSVEAWISGDQALVAASTRESS